MIKIGITGGIACGKSTILSYIKTQGYTIFSADEAFKSIFEREDVQNWIHSQIKTRKGEEEFKKYIGAPNDGTIVGGMLSTLNNLGIAFTNQKLITAFRDPKVVRNTVEPRQYDAELAIFPILGTNWIYIRLGIDT